MNDTAREPAEDRLAHQTYLVDALRGRFPETAFEGFTVGDVVHVYWIGPADKTQLHVFLDHSMFTRWAEETGQRYVLHELGWVSWSSGLDVETEEDRAAVVQCALALHLTGHQHAVRDRENGRTLTTGFHAQPTGDAGEVRISCKLATDLSAVGEPTYASAEERYTMQIVALSAWRLELEAQGWKISPEAKPGHLAYHVSPMSGSVWLVASK